jgi:hypothetical protein
MTKMIASVFVLMNPDERSDQFGGDSVTFETPSIPFGGHFSRRTALAVRIETASPFGLLITDSNFSVLRRGKMGDRFSHYRMTCPNSCFFLLKKAYFIL